jgi:hypothetical protein
MMSGIVSTNIVIVKCTNPKSWYANIIGAKLHIYGTIDNPSIMNDNYTCIENSASINIDDVILVK